MSLRRIPNIGSKSARIVLVGEAPGADEVEKGEPFVGWSGQLLKAEMMKVGINLADCYFANLCQFKPPSNELRAFHSPDGQPNELMLDGLSLLRAEIEEINPNVIVALGNYPLKYLTGRGEWKEDKGYSGITDYRGYLYEGNDFCGRRKVLPTYHPAAAVRDFSLKHLIKFDLGRVVVQQEFPEIRRPPKTFVIDPRGAERDLWATWLTSSVGTLAPEEPRGEGCAEHRLPSAPFLSGDIEFIGGQLLCIGFTRHRDAAVVFPTRTAEDRRFVRDILLSGIPLCFQNSMFDGSILEWFEKIEFFSRLRHDTMVAMHACYLDYAKASHNPGVAAARKGHGGAYDLGFIGCMQTEMYQYNWWETIDDTFWNNARKIFQKEGWSAGMRELERIYLPYNGYDVCVTHEAMENMVAQELRDPHFLDEYTLEMSLIKSLWDTGKLGVPVDTAQMKRLQETLESEVLTLKGGLAYYNDGIPVNPNSPKIMEFLYYKMGIPIPDDAKTPKGKWRHDDTTLAKLIPKCREERQRSAIRMVRAATERLALISKFCEIELDDDERFRCHYDPAKAGTTRLSSRKFYPTGNGNNLQNVPVDTRIRALLHSDRGYIFGYADLKSAESMVVAHITGDSEMLRLHSPEYMDGTKDGHKYVASFLLNKPIEAITKDERYLGKRVRHAGNYGMSWKKLMDLINTDSEETGVSVTAAEAKALIKKYRQLHWRLPEWWNSIEAQLNETHTIYTLHGTKRVFYGKPSDILPEAIAFNPQGTVARTLNMCWIRTEESYWNDKVNATLEVENYMRQWDMARALYGQMQELSAQLTELGFQKLIQVHDAIGFQVPEKNADKALPLLPKLMAIPLIIKRKGLDPYTLVIPVEIQTGYNWGESDEDPKRPGSGLTKAGTPATNPLGLKAWHG